MIRGAAAGCATCCCCTFCVFFAAFLLCVSSKQGGAAYTPRHVLLLLLQLALELELVTVMVIILVMVLMCSPPVVLQLQLGFFTACLPIFICNILLCTLHLWVASCVWHDDAQSGPRQIRLWYNKAARQARFWPLVPSAVCATRTTRQVVSIVLCCVQAR